MSEVVKQIDHILKELFPLCRSLTGNANRQTLQFLSEITPIATYEIPSGTQVYDWTIPEEWNINDAYIALLDGEKIIDFNNSNLHVMSYSTNVNNILNWDQLSTHLITHPTIPNAIPYRTSYYKKDWAFCVTSDQYNQLKNSHGPFSVVIDSSHSNGSLTYGEILIPGRSKKEILISCYICHPSMANDSLSGVILTTFLAKYIRSIDNLQYSYRIVFVPETIGAIAYSFLNEAAMKDISFGIVITTVGGKGKFGYKQSFDKSSPINRLVETVLDEAGVDYIAYPFDIHGSDERQYSSPGFRINTITISRDKYYCYDEYHTSLDNLSFVNANQIQATLNLYKNLINKIESRIIFKNQVSYGEVMLSRHDLYPQKGGAFNPSDRIKNKLDLILWLLFLSDGTLSVDDISERLHVPQDEILNICLEMTDKGVMSRV